MIYGLLGEHLSHSISPKLHRFIGGYDYVCFEIKRENLPNFFKKREFDFLNVTVPYKKDAYGYCDLLSDEARSLGNVNLIKKLPDGRLFGDNTDSFGFLCLLNRFGTEFSGKKAVIFGSGGAGSTAARVLSKAGATVVTVSRSGENNYSNLSRHYDADMLVNATPVGMFPNCPQRLIAAGEFKRSRFAVDLIYNPPRTAFLYDAERAGMKCENGLSMLVAQAVRSSEFFLGHSLADDVFEKAMIFCKKLLTGIALVGMPGCGKSTVGRLLSEKLGLPFTDTDEEAAILLGKTPCRAIEEDGEEYFRQAEAKVIRQALKSGGRIYATGGGAVLNPENRLSIMQSCVVIYLKAPLCTLETAGRPLSLEKDAVKLLFDKREPLYKSVSDIEIDVSPDANITADRAVKELLKCGFFL